MDYKYTVLLNGYDDGVEGLSCALELTMVAKPGEDVVRYILAAALDHIEVNHLEISAESMAEAIEAVPGYDIRVSILSGIGEWRLYRPAEKSAKRVRDVCVRYGRGPVQYLLYGP